MDTAHQSVWFDEPVTRPDPELEVPPPVRRLVGDVDLEPVWLNELGGLTFRAGSVFVKWSPTDPDVQHPEIDLLGEAERLRWASAYTKVPRVVDCGSDENCQWLVTEAMPGRSAADDRWLFEPSTAARAIGTGLREFHDSVPVADCPYDWSIITRVRSARSRGREPAHDNASFDSAPAEDIVVCHGDACAPNTIILDNGTVSGHVDLGSIGTADRWADLAPAIMSTEWNYGRSYIDDVLDGYRIELDAARFDFYRRLWDST